MENTRDKKNHTDIIEQMTLEEKARLVNGATFFGMAAIDRLGIPRLQLLDGGTGMNFEQLFGDYYSQMEEETNSTNGMMGSTVLTHVIDDYYRPEKLTEEELEVRSWIKEKLESQTKSDYAPGCFPPGILLGATFNKEVVHAVGEALGAEADLFGVDILLGTPNVNIHRDPLNGRLFEGYSEDPCLVSELAPELVKGVQKFGVAANVKHFAANNQETNRVGINETISERALKEIYLPGFKGCVQEGQVKTVMSAYNRINGVPCTESHWLLTEELRDNWGFDGMVVSDWGAVYHPVEAIEAGNDLAMPGPIDGAPIEVAVQSGRLEERVLNQAVERLLKLIDDCKQDVLKGQEKVTIGTAEVELVDKELGKYQKEQLMSATTKAAYDAAMEGIVLLKNENNTFPLEREQVSKVVIVGSGAKQLLECGTGSAGITTNRTSSLASGLKEVLGEQKVFLPDSNGYDYFDAIYCKEVIGKSFNSGEKKIVNLDATQHTNCDKKERTNLIADIDVQLHELSHVIVVAKVSGMEGNDRNDLHLNLQDDMLMKELSELKKQHDMKITLILNTCGPIETAPYEEFTDAIFVTFLPGMEGGRALADLMVGKQSPSGKLPITFPKRYEDTPTFLNFPGDGYEVNYGEGIYVGYRYYDKKKVEPAYPFGYGLSYTTFEVSDMQMKAVDKDAGIPSNADGTVSEGAMTNENDLQNGDEALSKRKLDGVETVIFDNELKLTVTVQNTGERAGAEVLQIYISDTDSTLPKPVKELKAFEKVWLEPGETKEVTFTLSKEQFASYDMDYKEWIAEEGYYDILVATSSSEQDVVQSERVYLVNQTPYSYGLNSPVKVLYEEPQLKECVKRLWDAKSWDWQIVESNYQYTANRKLSEILPEMCGENDEAMLAFIASVEQVVKL